MECDRSNIRDKMAFSTARFDTMQLMIAHIGTRSAHTKHSKTAHSNAEYLEPCSMIFLSPMDVILGSFVECLSFFALFLSDVSLDN